MSADPNNLKPAVPRDQGPTELEIIPFRSTKINIWKSKALIPLLLTGIVAVVLFTFLNAALTSNDENSIVASIETYIDVFGTFGIFAIFLGIYYYSGETKPWWWYLVPGVIVYISMATIIWDLYVILFNEILPGNTDTLPKNNPGFIPSFITYFIGVGLKEELSKAMPVLLAFILAARSGAVADRPAPHLKQLFTGKASMADIKAALALRGPLDGLLMGVAAGGAFTLVETLFGSSIIRSYVVNEITTITKASSNDAIGLLYGFMLMVPRVMNQVAGHIAWAGTFGYFIGLASRYRSHWIKLIAIGWVTVAVLHALWDTADTLPFPVLAELIYTIVSILVFVACLVKAKQLDLAWSGREADGDSILVTAGPTPFAAAAPPAAAAAAAPLSGGIAQLLGGLHGLASPGAHPAPPPVPAAPPLIAPVPESRFSIGTGTTRFALEAGRVIDFGALFGAAGAPAGATGEISHHPTDPHILGIKNTGTSAWTSTTHEGTTVTVPPGKNLRVAPGTRIMFGSLTLDIQTY